MGLDPTVATTPNPYLPHGRTLSNLKASKLGDRSTAFYIVQKRQPTDFQAEKLPNNRSGYDILSISRRPFAGSEIVPCAATVFPDFSDDPIAGGGLFLFQGQLTHCYGWHSGAFAPWAVDVCKAYNKDNNTWDTLPGSVHYGRTGVAPGKKKWESSSLGSSLRDHCCCSSEQLGQPTDKPFHNFGASK